MLLSVLWWYPRDLHTSRPTTPAVLGSLEEVDSYPDREVLQERSTPITFLSNISHTTRRTTDETSWGLFGRVTDWNDFPVSGASVQLRYGHYMRALDPLEAERLQRERALDPLRPVRSNITARVEANEQGVFFVPMRTLPTGVYQVVASAPGLAPERKLWAWTGKSGEINFRLAPGDSITGTVLDPAGRPVEGASVLALTQGGEGRGNWSGERELVNRTESAVDGAFRLDVYPGRFRLQARAPGYAPSRPQAVKSNSSGVELVLAVGRTLEGRVEGSSGQPIAQARISVWPENVVKHWKGVTLRYSALGSPYARCTTDGWGNFRVGDLPAGRFGLLTEKGGYTPHLTTVDLTASRNVLHAEVQLEEGWVLRGRVLGPDRQPVVGALVTVGNGRSDRLVEKDAAARREFSVWSAKRRFYQPIPISRATAAVETDFAGFFHLDTLEAISYDLSVVAEGLLPTRLEGLNPELGIQPLTIVLENGSSLEGQVVSSITGQGVAGAVLIIGRQGHRRLTRTDFSGRYHVAGLPEEEIDEIKVQAQGYGLKTLSDVTVAGGVNVLDVWLVPAIKVSGVVSDASGLPVSGAWVRIEPARDASELEIAEDERMRSHLQHKLSVSGQTDAMGHFVIENVNPASYLKISVRHPAYGVISGGSFAANWGEEISGLNLSFHY
jgi:protocatechuate 3,4-dioxygenase beta subunit